MRFRLQIIFQFKISFSNNYDWLIIRITLRTVKQILSWYKYNQNSKCIFLDGYSLNIRRRQSLLLFRKNRSCTGTVSPSRGDPSKGNHLTREGGLNERKAYVIAQESVNLVVCLCRCKKKAYETTSRIILKQTPIEN